MPPPASIELIIFDVDGVLTEGTVAIDDYGIESKHFFVRDGLAIRLAIRAGLRIACISGRSSRATTLRMMEMGIHPIMQGVRDKAAALAALCEREGIALEHCSFVGDDLVDLPAMRCCGYPVAIADAPMQVKAEAAYVSRATGGRGAAREVIAHILGSQGRWDQIMNGYLR